MKNNFAVLSLKLGIISVLLKSIFIGAYLYFFWQEQNSGETHPNEYIIYLIDMAAIIGFVSLVLFCIGVFKKQWGWKLYLSLPVSLLGTFAAPMVFTL